MHRLRAKHGWRHPPTAHIPVDVLSQAVYMAGMTHILDATGLLCPLPVLKARKCLKALETGETLTVTTDDPAAVIDIPHFCAEAGHDLIESREHGASMVWTIRKG